MKQTLKLVMILLLLGVGTAGWAQEIGGNLSPLKYAVHLYSIQMGDVTYTPNWALYQAGTTANEIEDGTAELKKMTLGTHYAVLAPSASEAVDATRAYWKIQFKDIAPGTYVIGYRESTGGTNDCLTAVVQGITVYPPLDVDIELVDSGDAASCGGQSGTPQGSTQNLNQLTTDVQYRVYMEYPDDPAYISSGGVGNWQFNFTVTATGAVAGANSTIAGISVNTGGTVTTPFASAVGQSNFTGTLLVPLGTTEVVLTITYYDVLGVDQSIGLQLGSIFGAYQEADVDIVENTVGGGGNNFTHTIYAMPNVGAITALN